MTDEVSILDKAGRAGRVLGGLGADTNIGGMEASSPLPH